MRILPRLAWPLFVLCLALVPRPGAAQPWQFDAALYGYFPSAGGTTRFPPQGGGGGGGSSVDIDGDPLLKHLKFAFMGSLAAHKGQWGAFVDYIGVDFGHTVSGSRAITIGGALPADASATIDYSLKGSLWTIAGTWRAPIASAYNMEVLLGARVLDITAHLNYALAGNVGSIALQDRAGDRSVGETNWDGIVGVRGRVPFAQASRWFVPYHLDVGTGDSELTWQAMAGVGYAFGWGDIVGAWRYIGYRMKSGQAIDTLHFNGPSIAAVFHW